MKKLFILIWAIGLSGPLRAYAQHETSSPAEEDRAEPQLLVEADLLRAAASLPFLTPQQLSKIDADALRVHAALAFQNRLKDSHYRQSLAEHLTQSVPGLQALSRMSHLAEHILEGRSPDEIERLTQAVEAAVPTPDRIDAVESLRTLNSRLSRIGISAQSDNLNSLLTSLEGFYDANGSGATGILSVQAGSNRPDRFSGYSLVRQIPAAPKGQWEALPTPVAPDPEKHKAMGLAHTTLLGINAIIGAGLFLFPGLMAAKLGPASILPFGLVGLLLIGVGFCYAEVATYFSTSGGAYLPVKAAFGERAGYGIGFMTWVGMMFGWATVATAISPALSNFFGPAMTNPWMTKIVATGIVAILSWLNYRGVKEGARASSLLTGIKVGVLVLFMGFGLRHLIFVGGTYTPFLPHGWGSFNVVCSMAYFAFQGFETVPVVAGDVRNPSRTIPKAILNALLISGAIYMLVQFIGVGALPTIGLSSAPLADASRVVIGPVGAALMAATAIISMIGFNAASALLSSNYLKAIAEGNHLPNSLADSHPRFHTPYKAILITAAISIGLIFLLNFQGLVDFTNLIVSLQYLAVCASVPVLRRTLKAPEGSYRVPWGRWFIPIGSMLAVVFLGSRGMLNDAGHLDLGKLGYTLGILLAGFAARAWWRRRRSATASE